MPPLRFLIAPDKFKGSLSATDVAQAMARGIRDVLPHAVIHQAPLADGGDGTAAILQKALGARSMRSQVHGPLGKKVFAAWGIQKSTAYLDFASASGLHQIPLHLRNPLKASSRGIGELLNQAVQQGARHCVLGVGGSASVDGGTGALRALGIRFLDRRGREIPEGGGGLVSLQRIDLERCTLRAHPLKITILADVENPLLGPDGAARVFGPQKGATPSMVRILETGLRHLDRAMVEHHGRSLASLPHGGAAGGIIAGWVGLLGSIPGIQINVVKGIDFVLETLKVEALAKKADWIFTGEGRLDSQTVGGKTIHGIAKLANRIGKPIVAFAGNLG